MEHILVRCTTEMNAIIAMRNDSRRANCRKYSWTFYWDKYDKCFLHIFYSSYVFISFLNFGVCVPPHIKLRNAEHGMELNNVACSTVSMQ
jgi:hypothetical protein